MTARRKLARIVPTRAVLARIALLGAAPLLLTALAAMPAQAHGALENPVSRVVACSPEGGQAAQSAACRAAVAVSAAKAFADWDNLRVPNINGRDRQLIPDGKLCSGNLPAYRGLDLPRADWPATKLTAGAAFTFTYRTTIPHAGSFRMYVTRDGYDPTQPLKWSDLESKPFLTADNPTLTGGAYVMRGKLPAGKSGRHLIYTIWQTTSTPDTYYSCSDVVFTGAAGGSTAAAPTTAAAAAPGVVRSDAADARASAVPTSEAPPSQVAATTKASDVPLSKASNASSALPYASGGAAVLAVVAGACGFFLRRRRRDTATPPA
jgi:predicted carbohydrate-binding protein with CBM5 and CBM33 domain